MSHDVPFPLYQDPDLSYLCGLLEPSSLLACLKPAAGAESRQPRWYLFVRPSNKAQELWDGARAGVDGAQTFFLPEGSAHSIKEASNVLAKELSGGRVGSLYYSPSANPQIDTEIRPMLLAADLARARGQLPASRLVQQLRVRKSHAEQDAARTKHGPRVIRTVTKIPVNIAGCVERQQFHIFHNCVVQKHTAHSSY